MTNGTEPGPNAPDSPGTRETTVPQPETRSPDGADTSGGAPAAEAYAPAGDAVASGGAEAGPSGGTAVSAGGVGPSADASAAARGAGAPGEAVTASGGPGASVGGSAVVGTARRSERRPARVPNARKAPGGSPGDGRAARRGRRRAGSWTPWLYLAPALLVLGGLLVYPIYQLGLISFLEYTQAQVSGGEPTTFQGLGNYRTLLADSQFWQVLLATVVFAAACVLATLTVGCALAVLLTRVRALPSLALMLAALGAWATPAITGSTVWVFLFDPDYGPVNRLLGLGDFSWTYGRYSAFALVLLEVVWCSFPFVMVTVYAGIKAIPSEILEAASLDGASQWRIWRSVTAPMLRPILVVVIIQSIIWDFKVFTQIYVMTNGGGIAGQNLVLNVYAYQKAFASSQYSLGSAIGVVMLLILLAVTLVYLRLLRRQGEEL
ncbi:N,N'-diacetylchitobiose transport system permease protein [Streptomyces sp. V1I1]|nr:N,N'-diacetylchitobiose transport system permease protein [Streptomyces sp. V1I1]